uniref:Uncharacterized protein n=1 Tax=Anguilla anguilla TaxID=7936 RepID=A0A0E9X3P1_ANGAN
MCVHSYSIFKHIVIIYVCFFGLLFCGCIPIFHWFIVPLHSFNIVIFSHLSLCIARNGLLTAEKMYSPAPNISPVFILLWMYLMSFFVVVEVLMLCVCVCVCVCVCAARARMCVCVLKRVCKGLIPEMY